MSGLAASSERPSRGRTWTPAYLAAQVRRSSEIERALSAYAGDELAGPETELYYYGSSRTGTFQEVPHTSRILQLRSGHSRRVHRVGELYDEMLEADIDLAAQVKRRKNAVLAVPTSIEPADSSPAAVQAAELCRYGKARIRLFQEVRRKFLDAPFRGIHFSELIWERLSRGPWAGAWLPVDIKDRPMHRFAFERGTHRLHLRHRGGAQPTPAPPYKFFQIRAGSRDGPWGEPELDHCYWLWYVKRYVFKYYPVWLEKWAHPLPVVKYPYRRGDTDQGRSANEAEVDRALELIAAIATEMGLALPNDQEVTYLESTRNGSITYEPFFALVRSAYALLLGGEVDTSGLGDAPGSFAKSKVSNTVRLEVISQDGHLEGSATSDEWLRWIVEVNLGPDVPPPRFLVHTVDAEDRRIRLEGIDKAREWGLPVTVTYARMTALVPEPVDGEAVLEPPAPAAALPGGIFPFAAPRPGNGPRNLQGRRNLQSRLHLAAGDEADEDLAALDALTESHEAELAQAVERLRRPTFDYYQAHRQAVLAAWDEAGGPGAQGGQGLLARTVRRLGQLPIAHARALQAAGLQGAGLALWQLRGEVQDAVRLAHAVPPSGYERADTPEAAIEFWSRQLQVDPAAFDELDDLLRRLAFRVAGVEDTALLGQVHRLVEESIAEGLTRTAFGERLDALYEAAGLTPTSSWHADLIYDNNIRQAHEAVRHRQIVDNPAVHRLVPYIQWVTLADGRVRQRTAHNHAVMHLYTAATSQEIWQVWSTPAGHGCRCRRRLINARLAQRLGYTGAEPSGPWPIDPLTGGRALPDPGFRSAARAVLTDAGTAAESRAEGLLDRARAEGADDLIEALQSLFNLLGLLDRIGV